MARRRVGHFERGTKLRKGLVLGEVEEIGETEGRPELRAGKLIVIVMPIDVNSRADGVTAVRPGQHVMPTVVLMHPASRPPLVISGQACDVDIGKTLVAHRAGIESVGIDPGETGIVQKFGGEGVRPVQFGEETRCSESSPDRSGADRLATGRSRCGTSRRRSDLLTR